MRVALVCPYSWSFPGGVQSHVAGLAAHLRGTGLDVEILAPADDDVAEPGFIPLGPTLAIPDNGSLVRVALSPAAAARAARAVRTRRYDVVHLHEPMVPAVCLAALHAAEAPLVGTFHMYAPSPRWYCVFLPVCRGASARLDARIAVSRAARRHVERALPGEYRIVPNGIDLGAYAALEERRHDRVLFVGRPERRKGLQVLLAALERLPGVRADLVGVDERALRRLAPRLGDATLERIEAHGTVDDERRVQLLARAALLCAPALGGESFGVVLLEAMAAGTPVVASAIPGYVDVVPPSCGTLVPPGDPAALAAAIERLLADRVARALLGAAGRREACRYAWERVGAEIVGIYEAVVARSRAFARAA